MQEKRERRRVLTKQALRFVLSGAIVTLIDLGVLNTLLILLGVEGKESLHVSTYFICRVVAFWVAAICGYVIHKRFTFQSSVKATTREFSSFVIIAGLGFVANVGISTLIFAGVQSIEGLSVVMKANLASILATGVSLVVHFIGYKLIVFKK